MPVGIHQKLVVGNVRDHLVIVVAVFVQAGLIGHLCALQTVGLLAVSRKLAVGPLQSLILRMAIEAANVLVVLDAGKAELVLSGGHFRVMAGIAFDSSVSLNFTLSLGVA